MKTDLETRRRVAIEAEVESYNFADYYISENGVSGFEYTSPGREYAAVIWLRSDELDEIDGDDLKANLNVIFTDNNSDEIEDIYVTLNGNNIGNRAYREDDRVFETKELLEAYQSGKSASEQGLQLSDNPYSNFSDEYMEWESGWEAYDLAKDNPSL